MGHEGENDTDGAGGAVMLTVLHPQHHRQQRTEQVVGDVSQLAAFA